MSDPQEDIATFAMYIALIQLSFQQGTSWTILRAMLGPLQDATKKALLADVDGNTFVQIEQPIPDDVAEMMMSHEVIPDHLPDEFS